MRASQTDICKISIMIIPNKSAHSSDHDHEYK